MAHEDKDTENGIKITPTTSENINKEITKQDSKSEKNHEDEGWFTWLMSDPLKYWNKE
ncbi:hypothetical protein CKC_02890 [Candidatus Liberibacter solanacearum CLso-ZC1]|uniref:Uncharacterized protein n=1 Tax=Liberibacter solanacearum (strain CLso-ZC1) TaxID=658172 RepID=E4UD87_LIBSC|nr:hypothetical protein CKC_02890 [Candidatus Liberibacter solanacearum CLso-ZC1]